MRRSFIGIALAAALAVVAAFARVPAASAAAAAPGAGGFDNPACHPSLAHPSPVVLLHGLGGNGPGDLGSDGLQLAGAGYCVFELTYGEEVPGIPVGGLVDVHQSAREIHAFIEQVRSETGAAKVDIVGHSEGGFQALFVPKVFGLGSEVDRVVGLAPPTHGTTFGGLVSVADTLQQRQLVDQLLTQFGCPACSQLIAGGAGVTELDDGPIAQAGVAYTIIASKADVLVTPHTPVETAFIAEPGVTNEYVQDTCPLDPVGHIGLAFDPDVEQLIANALDPAHATPVTCSVGPPF